jgi:hypothetical protein
VAKTAPAHAHLLDELLRDKRQDVTIDVLASVAGAFAYILTQRQVDRGGV